MKLAVVGLCLSPAVETSWYQRSDPIAARARNLPIVFSGFPKGSFLFGTLMRGQQPLEELEKMALSRFSRVRVGKGQAGCSGEKTQLGASPVLPRRSRAIPLCRGQRIKWAGCSVELHRPAWVAWVPVTGSRADRPDAGRIVKSVPLKEVRVTHGDPSYSEHGPKISKNQGPSGLQVAGHVWH